MFLIKYNLTCTYTDWILSIVLPFQYMEISVKELEESPLKEHEHTFFKLVYILSGTGLQCINNNKFDYHEGHMFLITPQDCHSFDIHTTTKFFFIRFNDIYIYSFWFLWN